MVRGSIRVLLIEDDEDDYILIGSMLSEIRSSKVSLDWVKTYEDGLEAMGRGMHDVVLLDLQLGARTGLELLHEAVENGIDTPVILLTGRGAYQADVEAMEAGAADYLVKGQISPDLLERSIRYSISRKHAELELKSYRDHLEELVDERTRQLVSVNGELRLEMAEREKIEEALADSEKKNRELVENSLDIIYTVLPDGTFSSLNPAFESITGYSAGEWLGRPFFLMVHPDDRYSVLDAFKEVMAGLTVPANEVRFLSRSGACKILELKTVPKARGGKIVGLIGTARDITKRKNAENSIRKQKEFLTTVIESLHHPFYVLDARDYSILMANTAAAPAGLAPNTGCHTLYLEQDKPCGTSQHLCSLEKIKETGQPLVTEHLHYDEKGNIRHVEVHGYPILDGKGDVVQIIEYSLDTTERKRVEEELRKARDDLARERSLLHAVLNQMPAGVIVAEPSGRVILSNKQAVEILEHPQKHVYHRDEYLEYHSFHPDGRPYDVKEFPLTRSLENGEHVIDKEIHIVLPHSAASRIVLASSSPVRDPSGNIVAAVVTFQDITDRKRAEDELHRRAQEYRALVENSPDVVIRVDRQLRRVFANKALEVMTGFPLSSFMGLSIYEPPREDRREYVALMEKACAAVFSTGKEGAFDFPYPTTKGTRYFHMRLVPEYSKEGRIESLLTISRDITKAKQIQEELERSKEELELRVRRRTAELAESNQALKLDEARLEALWELSRMTEASTRDIADFTLEQQIMLTRSKVGAIGLMNEEENVFTLYACTADLLGRGEVISKPVELPIERFSWLSEVINKRGPIVVSYWGSNLDRTDNGMPSVLHRFMSVPVFEADRIVAIAMAGNKEEDYDPSDIRQLTLLLDGMWKSVQHLAAEKSLREAESLAAMGSALSAVAHDIKTPLVAIGGLTRLVLGHLKEGCVDRSKLEVVVTEVHRLETMLKNILDFSRPLELERSFHDLDRLIVETLPMVEDAAREHQLRIETHLQDLPPVSLDAMRMKQVIINLLMNAIQATPPGKVVSISTRMKGAKLLVDITDCGCGIPVEKRDKIFVPFASTKKEGTGLGLSISKKIVEAHRGSIQVLDNEGEGVTFRLNFPALTEEQDPEGQAA